MGLLRQLSESLGEQRYDDARQIALKIEASGYPSSLKDAARKTLRKLGRQQIKSLDICSECLYQTVRANTSTKEEVAPSWLPWRIILDCSDPVNNEGNSQSLHETALEIYTQSYLAEGINTLHYLHEVSHEAIKSAITNFFDYEYYKESHPDMRDSSEKDALAHYVIHGGSEYNRRPNRLFSNEDLFQCYPWTKQLNINALYLFVRWPEQFADVQRLIANRYCALKNQIILPWERPVALTANQINNPSDFDYFRVLAITKESSGKERLITPDFRRLHIHIVIPDFAKGGGGHMTIFRMILHLEKAGHKCTVWVKNFSYERHPEGPRMSAIKFYQPINAQVLPLSTHFAFARGDAIIATSWDTVEIVCANQSFHDYFYLVQDYEPYFYPRGSESLEAELTYSANIKTICASSWLDTIMRDKFNRKSTYFSLSYNPSIYSPKESENRTMSFSQGGHQASENIASPPGNNPIVRIAFYARFRTGRRAVSLALKAIEKLKQSSYTICVELFGEHKGQVKLPSNVVGHDNGILEPVQLAELYQSCDIGLTFSATNYSLVPQEMMACGLAVIEIDNDSTRSVYPEGVLVLAEPSARAIADAIDNLATDQGRREEIANNGLRWVQQTSWDLSFQKVESFICNEVKKSSSISSFPRSISDQYLKSERHVVRRTIIENSLVSVVIPVYQGGTLLKKVIEKVQCQVLDEPFEIIVIDSSSTDGVIENLSDYPNLSIYRIEKKSFQHGHTRNLGVALAGSPYVSFLTQDSVPVNDKWLANLIRPLQDNQDVVATFGGHRAHPDHPIYLDKWIKDHFDRFRDKKLYRKSEDLRKYYQKSPRCRQFLHYYSDNNSCLRKLYWENSPYPDVFYGEDQLWADWVIQSDGIKAYADDATVYHSHDYTEEEEYDRAKTEAFFFLKYFGYELGQNRLEIEVGIEKDARTILCSASEGIQAARAHLLRLLRAKREGYKDGCLDFMEWLRTT